MREVVAGPIVTRIDDMTSNRVPYLDVSHVALADLLAQERHTLVLNWENNLRELALGAPCTSVELANDIEPYIAELEAALRRRHLPETPHFARVHGAQRYRIGFSLSALIKEYDVLRACIFTLARHTKPQASLEELDFLCSYMNTTVAAAVTEYTRRTDAALRAENDGLVHQNVTLTAASSERKRLYELFQNAPAGICSFGGRDLVYEFVNPLYQVLMGRDRQLQGLPLEAALPEVKAQGYIDLLTHVYDSGEPFVDQGRLARLDRVGDGTLDEAYFTFVLQPRRDTHGTVEGIDAFAFEVTDQVLARRDAEAAQKALLERAEFEQQLIGMVSHDLRNPLSGVALSVECLLRRGGLDRRTLSSIERIHRANQQALRLVRDLLDFTRARLGTGIPVRPRDVELNAVTCEAVDDLRALFPDQLFDLDLGPAAAGLWDADRLTQLIGNLVTNAVQYGQAGKPIVVSTRDRGNHVEIGVHNQGNVIPAASISQLFRPLQRGQICTRATLSRRSIGLGLYIVDQIAKAHGGRVEATSTLSGTMFRVILPRSEAMAG